MKLCTYSEGNESRIGIVRDDRVIDLTGSLPDCSRTLVGVIEQWSLLRDQVQGAESRNVVSRALSEVRLLPPIPHPRKILAIGLNYADHIAESRLEAPKEQLWFCKQPTSINGPFDAIEIPRVSTMIDYEAELVAVIGKRGRHILKEDAARFVFGYMAGNDVSVRDWQKQTPQWMLGKSFDTHAPTGPWVTTADEVGDPHALDIRCIVNGEIRQQSNTRNLVFNVFDQIAHLSKVMTLEPGDLIFTGTPGGVGAAMKPPKFLAAGDRVRVEIAKLGAIEGKMAPEAASSP